MWSTYLVVGLFSGVNMPQGVNNQLNVSLGNITASDTDWQNAMIGTAPVGRARDLAIAGLYAFIYGNQNTHYSAFYVDPVTQVRYTATNTDLDAQVPFAPTSKRYQTLTWQANDPLVHYTVGDLSYLAGGTNTVYPVIPPNSSFPLAASNFWKYTDRFDPWGGNPQKGSDNDSYAYNMSLKDPLVRSSDDWDFPTNKFPNVGWLGRVHRGTPWQTVYLKSSDITNFNNWKVWTGDAGTWSVGNANEDHQCARCLVQSSRQ